jgi:hypothetical protein
MTTTRSYQDTAWWRDDITAPQREALRKLAATATGGAYAGNLRGVRLTTLRALHRFGLVKTDTGDVIQSVTFVTITQSGRDSIASGN